MRFPQPLVRGRLVARYKRFFADVELDDGGTVTAHCANPGRMLGLLDVGNVCWLSPATGPGRRLRWTLELVEVAAGAPVGVNTQAANPLAAEAIAAGGVPVLAGYERLRREIPYGTANRIDLLLESDARPPCWVEVKSVTLCRERGLAEWPDSVSSRSSKQLAALEALVAEGARAALLFVVQRADCDRFAVAADIDPTFGRALASAIDAGVEVVCAACTVDPVRIEITSALPSPVR